MVAINIENDLSQINQQLVQVVEQFNKLNAEREEVNKQIHYLNGIAMYLRGKQQEESENIEEPVPERVHEYPPNEGEDA